MTNIFLFAAYDQPFCRNFFCACVKSLFVIKSLNQKKFYKKCVKGSAVSFLPAHQFLFFSVFLMMKRCGICNEAFSSDEIRSHMGEHLKVACSTNNVELMKRSIQDINYTDRHGVSAAYVAAESGHCDILHNLGDLGASLEIANQNGWSPIHVASQQGHSLVIKSLAKRNVSLNLRSANRSGSSPIILACTNGHLSTLIVLLDLGANLDSKNSLGQGPVHICCMYGYDKCLMLLLARGAEYTASDTNGFTPIEFAVMFGHDDCIRVLMERGIQNPGLEQLPPVLPAQKVSYLK